MAQVTIYMDDETAARTRAAAKEAGLSVSAWITGLVQARTRDEWPAEIASLAGAWSDLPTQEEIRTGEGRDVPREAL